MFGGFHLINCDVQLLHQEPLLNWPYDLTSQGDQVGICHKLQGDAYGGQLFSEVQMSGKL